jgi:hypothetical protein
MSDAMSENVAKLIGPYWRRLAGLDITRQHWTSAEMPIDMDLQVLSSTSRTVQSQTGSQEVRGFESLRLHPIVITGGRGPCSQDTSEHGRFYAFCAAVARREDFGRLLSGSGTRRGRVGLACLSRMTPRGVRRWL